MAPPPSPVVLLDGRGFSSPSTPPPPTSFRELDDAFLQNQTRIWLGEVLNMRFDKDMNISDLLADGQILFGMYKVFRKMLLSEDHSSHQKFLERESVSSSEITEIFPYAKVERFLEVCQSMGLADIDLITTSDVVDKRNTRKVCMCLRSLAKKARSRNLNVPDFDCVTHRRKSPITMPANMVGNRRRDLERSSSSPVPVSLDMRKGSRLSGQEASIGFHADSSAYKSDVSDDDDDCESYSVVGGGSTDSSANGTSPRTTDPSMVRDFVSVVQCELEQLNNRSLDGDENAENECMSVAESFDITSPSKGHGSGVGDNFQPIDDQSNHGLRNNLLNHSPILLDWQDASLPMDKAADTAGPSPHSLIKASDTFTAYDEAESNRGNAIDYSPIKLADGENGDLTEASSVGDKEVFVHDLDSNLEGVSTNDMETTGESVAFQHSCDASWGQRTVEEVNSGENTPLPVADDVDTLASGSPRQESGKFAVGSAETMQQGKGVDLICEHCGDIPCIEDMKAINDPSNPHYRKTEVVSNGDLGDLDEANFQLHVGANDLPRIEDDEKDEREDLNNENKKVAQQCKPPRKMLKLIAGGTGTVAAAGLLLFWLQLRAGRRNQPKARSFPIFLSNGGFMAFLGGLARGDKVLFLRNFLTFLGGLAGGDNVANLLR